MHDYSWYHAARLLPKSSWYHAAGHQILTSAFGPVLISVVLAVVLAAAMLGLRRAARAGRAPR